MTTVPTLEMLKTLLESGMIKAVSVSREAGDDDYHAERPENKGSFQPTEPFKSFDGFLQSEGSMNLKKWAAQKLFGSEINTIGREQPAEKIAAASSSLSAPTLEDVQWRKLTGNAERELLP